MNVVLEDFSSIGSKIKSIHIPKATDSIMIKIIEKIFMLILFTTNIYLELKLH
jgi:hypothetical protein